MKARRQPMHDDPRLNHSGSKSRFDPKLTGLIQAPKPSRQAPAAKLTCVDVLALVAVALLGAAPVQAQVVRSRVSPAARSVVPAPKTSEDDGLAGGGFYLEADVVTQNENTHHVVADGSVEARYKGRVLRAEHVDYDSESGLVAASGKVQVLSPDGTAQFAESLTLDKTMSTGFAEGFSTRLQGNVKIAAASARRKNADVTTLDHVVFTPCPVCADNGETHPTWSIQARSVVEDKRRKTLTFRHAVIEILGLPVFYVPVITGPDPTSARKSGLLLPVVTFAGRRGPSYEQPYYKVLSASSDLTLTPQINVRVNPFLNLEWRKRFYSGLVDVRAGYTYDQDFTSGGDKFGARTSRSFILGSGVFQLSPKWQWGFTAERTSDKLIFDKYSVGDVFLDRGLYATDDRRLISQLYAVRQDTNAYLSVAAISVQGLRATDLQSSFPTVAPLIEARWEPKSAVLGGRLRLNGSAVVLTRDQSSAAIAAATTAGQLTDDSRRATGQADWERSFTFKNGLRIQPFLDGRVDVYNVTGLTTAPSNGTLTRAFGTLGANITYPLIKQAGDVTWILEPMAQLAVSPNTRLDARIPNEDSQVFEFDETNLFEVNRSPGYDLYEGGQSVTLGGRATAFLTDGRNVSFIVGRRFAVRDDLTLPDRTGLRSALSDYIFAADAIPFKGIRVFSRLRLDSETFALNRLETGASFTTARLNGYVSYVHEIQSPTGGRVSSLDLHGEAFVTRHWGATTYAIIDNGNWRRRDFGVVYRDDCLRVEVLYRHDETTNGTLGPSSSVVLRLSLATFGNSGYNH